jgi:hypothetical protein
MIQPDSCGEKEEDFTTEARRARRKNGRIRNSPFATHQIAIRYSPFARSPQRRLCRNEDSRKGFADLAKS